MSLYQKGPKPDREESLLIVATQYQYLSGRRIKLISQVSFHNDLQVHVLMRMDNYPPTRGSIRDLAVT